MRDRLKQIREEAINNMENLNSLESLENFRIKYMGKKGKLTLVLREMGNLSKEERPVIGQLANEIRMELEEELYKASERIKKN